MKVKMFNELPYEAKTIRKAVFMNEQGFENEFDEIDENAIHIVMYQEEKPVAVCRFFWSDSSECFIIGRIAVSKEYRGRNYGTDIIRIAEQEILNRGGLEVMVSAQCNASGFYKKLGYKAQGNIYLDEYCPHICMRKELRENDCK